MIREAKKTDLNDISKILKEVHNLHKNNRPEIFKELKEPINMDYYGGLLKSDNCKIFINIDNDTINGYMTLIIQDINNHPVYHDKKILKMEDLAVLTEYKNKGIGSKLFNYAMNYAKEIEADKMELQVWNFNDNAKEFYTKQSMKVRSLNLELNIG